MIDRVIELPFRVSEWYAAADKRSEWMCHGLRSVRYGQRAQRCKAWIGPQIAEQSVRRCVEKVRNLVLNKVDRICVNAIVHDRSTCPNHRRSVPENTAQNA